MTARIACRCFMLLSLLVPLASVSAEDADTLYLFNWSQYMDPSIIEAFEAEHEVEVVENYFNSNGEMFSKLQAGGVSQYDVVVPSNYYVPRLIESDLVQRLDKAQIPNLDNLMETFIDPAYDPGNDYSAAYQWGTTGLVYDRSALGEQPASWSVLFDPDVNPDAPFAVPEDGQVTLGAACAYLGHGYDCTDRDALEEAARLVLDAKARDNFAGFIQGTPVLQQLVRGSVSAGMTFNGDYFYLKEEDPEGFADIEFVIPEEGAEIWVDTMMIPADAPNPELAHAFINFILDAEVGAQLSNWNYYSSPNAAALPLLNEVLQAPPISPTDETMETLAFTPSLMGDELQFLQQIWREVESR
ncbi:extracellular solute-binding protein [Spiribacter salinus M19-40]|uniref:Putrescine-binding periplasmic protein n=1 Tax=Spiribacter salinus M19-40 TaxID=1260251 RepID=R4V708_9GAMM|nr:spermidine/putrescine ABC transporter substrate-binding protein [Spiribacter salinus]AGM40785.1 extracellular solute-binding protein [Spiribacter salinus M19-40]